MTLGSGNLLTETFKREMPLDSIYRYDPSVPGMIVAIVLFALVTAHQGYIMFRHKTWYWMPFWLGGVFEVVGYIVRIKSRDEPSEVGLYAVQTLFILLPPAMFSASLYMTLGRLLLYIDAEFTSIIPARFMTKLFVTGDVMSFLLQGAGGGLQGSSDEYRDAGKWVTIGGLVIQLLFFGGYVITKSFAYHKLRKLNWRTDFPGKFKWPILIWTLYCSSVLILVRSIFRVIEYAQGYDGYLMSHEIYMYIFDALLMFICMLLFNVVHPAYVMDEQARKEGLEKETHEMNPHNDNVPLRV